MGTNDAEQGMAQPLCLTAANAEGAPFVFGLRPQDELASPAHFTVLETTSRNQSSEPPSATMIPQMTVIAGLTRSEE